MSRSLLKPFFHHRLLQFGYLIPHLLWVITFSRLLGKIAVPWSLFQVLNSVYWRELSINKQLYVLPSLIPDYRNPFPCGFTNPCWYILVKSYRNLGFAVVFYLFQNKLLQIQCLKHYLLFISEFYRSEVLQFMTGSSYSGFHKYEILVSGSSRDFEEKKSLSSLLLLLAKFIP